EVLTWRLKAIGPAFSMDFSRLEEHSDQKIKDASRGTRKAYFPSWAEFRDVQVLDRYSLPSKTNGKGPAIFEESESTTMTPTGSAWEIDQTGALMMTLGGQK